MRYRALRIVATIYRILGWIVIVVGTLSSCGLAAFTITAPGWFTGAPMGYGYGATEGVAGGVIGAIIMLVMGLIMTALYGITLLALAEAIYVFLDIEENTREVARRLRELPGMATPRPGTPE